MGLTGSECAVFVVTSANGFSDNDNLARAYKNCWGLSRTHTLLENPYTVSKSPDGGE